MREAGLQRGHAEAAEPTPAPATDRALRAGDRVFVRDGERCWFVDVAEISHIAIEGNYAHAHFRGQRALIARSLATLEERLDDELFFRASRTILVNLRHIEQIDPSPGEGYCLRRRDGSQVEVSRRQARTFRERLAAAGGMDNLRKRAASPGSTW